MPESWVEAHYNFIRVSKYAQEAAARYMALLERGDEIAGYDWETVCEANDYDLVGFDVDEEDLDALEAEAEAA